MEVDDRVRSLPAADLAPVVRQTLGVEDAWPTRWECQPLVASLINPITMGLFRVEGVADVGTGREAPWMVVLKVVGDVDLIGTPLDSGYCHEPQDWNYWYREALAYRSGFLERFRGPFVAARCFACLDVDVAQTWIWLEALDGAAPRPHWSLDQLAQSAYDLGVFAAQAQDEVQELESYTWAARNWLRGWVASIDALGAGHAAEHAGCWESPLVCGSLTASARARFAALMRSGGRLLQLLESFPTTVAHHDAQHGNLFQSISAGGVRHTVAIDWSYLGSASVGEDLGSHIANNIFNRAIDPQDAADHDALSTAAYLEGLRDFGWSGEERQVLLARAARGALQLAPFYAVHLSWLCSESVDRDEDLTAWPEALAADQNLSIEDAMQRWTAGFDYVLGLGDEARDLAATLD